MKGRSPNRRPSIRRPSRPVPTEFTVHLAFSIQSTVHLSRWRLPDVVSSARSSSCSLFRRPIRSGLASLLEEQLPSPFASSTSIFRDLPGSPDKRRPCCTPLSHRFLAAQPVVVSRRSGTYSSSPELPRNTPER